MHIQDKYKSLFIKLFNFENFFEKFRVCLSRGGNDNSLVVLFFVIGFCSESIDVKEEMRFESIPRMLIRLGLAAVFVQVIAGAAAYKAIH